MPARRGSGVPSASVSCCQGCSVCWRVKRVSSSRRLGLTGSACRVGGQPAVAQLEHDLGEGGDARGGLAVAHGGLHGAEGAGGLAPAIGGRQGGHLDRVAELGPGAVRLDHVDGGRVGGRAAQGLTEDPGLGGGAGGR
ncbi:hypothetical protein GCM10020000_75760 [Streptomyces olivoverticillatus]